MRFIRFCRDLILVLFLVVGANAQGDSQFFNEVLSTMPASVRTDLGSSLLEDYFADILPDEYTYISTTFNLEFKKITDRLTLSILAKPSGLQFCRILNNHPSALQGYMGLSKEGARQASDLCVKLTGEPVGSLVAASRHMNSSRQFWLVMIDEKDIKRAPFKAWTGMSNQTVLAFTINEINEKDLTQAMFHEFAIGFDSKYQIDEFWLKKNGVALSGDLCTALSAINMPLVKMSLSTLRANTVEARAAGEFKWEMDPLLELSVSKSKTCIQKVEKTAQLLNKNPKFLTKSETYYYPFFRPFCQVQPDLKLYPLSLDGLQQSLIVISGITVSENGGLEKGLCEYLAEPAISSQQIMYSRGPKPRIIGGW